MFQSDRRAKTTARQPRPTVPIMIDLSVACGTAGMARSRGPIYRRDEPGQPNETLTVRWIPSYASLGFGMDGRRVARNFQFPQAARGRLRHDPPVWSSVLSASIVEWNAMLVLVPKRIAMLGTIVI